jgi:hypothetical protein
VLVTVIGATVIHEQALESFEDRAVDGQGRLIVSGMSSIVQGNILAQREASWALVV